MAMTSALIEALEHGVQAALKNPGIEEKLVGQATEKWGPNAANYIKQGIEKGKIARQAGTEEAFTKGISDSDAAKMQAPKSAEESAQVFDAPENKQGVMIGEPKDTSPPIQSQQTAEGIKPDPSTVEPAPETALVPIERDVTPPATLTADTTEKAVPEALKAEESAPPSTDIKVPTAEEVTKPGMSRNTKIAAGAIPAAILAGGMLGGTTPPSNPTVDSAASMPEKTPPVTDLGETAITAKRPVAKTAAASSGLSPGAQAGIAAGAMSEAEPTVAAAPKPSDILNFESRDNGPNELAQLLKAQQDAVREAKMQQGADMLGAGIAGAHGIKVTPHDSYAQDIAASGLPIEQFKLRQANEENDPNSGISTGMRSYLKDKLGVNVSDNATATQMKQIVPYVFKDMEAKQAQAAKHEDMAMRTKELEMRHKELSASKAQAAADRKQRQQEQDDIKKTRDQDKASENFSKAFSSFRGNTAVQQAAASLKNSEAAMAIINSKPDYNKIDQPMYNTLTAEIAKIATGGAATEGSSHDMRAQTLQSKAAAFWQNVSGNPTGAQLGKFIEENKDYLDHLNEINNRWVNNYKADIYRGFRKHMHPTDQQEFEEAHPEVMEAFNSQGKTKPMISGQDPTDKAAIALILRKNPGMSIGDAIKNLQEWKASQH